MSNTPGFSKGAGWRAVADKRAASTRRAAAVRVGAALCLTATLVAGCGYWLGEEEDPLEGERIALRSGPDTRLSSNAGLATPPQAQALSEWSQAGGAATRNVGNIQGSVAIQRQWSTSIGAGSDSESRITAAPVAAGGRVFALDAAAEVTAVSSSGDRIWRTDLAPEDEDGRDGFGGGLAISGDTLVAATGFGEVIGLNVSDGSEKWRSKAGAPIRSAPAVSRGLAVVVTRDGVLTAFDVATGTQRWSVIGIEGGASMLGGAGPAISGEVVAAPFASGDIAIFRLGDGRRGWSEPLGSSLRGSGLSLIADISAAPVMADGKIYAGGVAGRVVALDIPSGRRIWGRDVGSYNLALPAGSAVYIASEDARVMALDANTGDTIWETQLPRFDDPEDKEDPYAYGGPIMVGGKLYLTSTDSKLFKIDAATGAIEAEGEISDGTSIPPIFVDNQLYILDTDGDLHAYR